MSKPVSINYIDASNFDPNKLQIIRYVPKGVTANSDMHIYIITYDYGNQEFGTLNILFNDVKIASVNKNHHTLKISQEYDEFGEKINKEYVTICNKINTKVKELILTDGKYVVNFPEGFGEYGTSIKYSNSSHTEISKIVLVDSKTNEYNNRYLSFDNFHELVNKRTSKNYYYVMNFISSFRFCLNNAHNNTSNGTVQWKPSLSNRIQFGEIKLNKSRGISVIKNSEKEIKTYNMKDITLSI